MMRVEQVAFPEEMAVFIDDRIAEGGYASLTDYLQALVREAQKRCARLDIDAKLREGLASGPSGPMTREDWSSIEAEALARIAVGPEPS